MRGSGLKRVVRAGCVLVSGAAFVLVAGCAANSTYAPVTYHHKTDAWNRPLTDAGDTSKQVPIPGSMRYERVAEAQAATEAASAPAPRYGSVQREAVTSESLSPAPGPSAAPMQIYTPTYIGGTNDSYARNARPIDPPIAPLPEAAPAPQVASAPSASAGGSVELTVQPGDTLYGLARAHGADRQAIIAANNLEAPYSLNVGQRIIIPRNEGVYTVQAGDTLYSVSRASGVDVRTLAAANRIDAPYHLSVGQPLRIPSAGGQPTQLAYKAPEGTVGGPFVKPGSQPKPAAGSPAKTRKAPSAPTGFAWPAKGQVLSEFGPKDKGQRNDGITLRLPEGAAIRAARGGDVIYVGNELKGFGNLVLIRHENGYVTAYAHASRTYVRRGDYVERGQHIADVGQTGDAREPQLHFEIRKDRKPVDPRRFLPAI